MEKTKLIIAIFNPDGEAGLLAGLNKEKVGITLSSGSGGFLNKKKAIAYIGVAEKNVDRVLQVIKRGCKSRTEYAPQAPTLADPGELVVSGPIKITIGGAVIFVIDADMMRF